MDDLGGVGRMLVVAGLALALVGGLLWLASRFPGLRLGSLPGDIRIVRDGFRFYFPLTTMILLSAVVSAVLWIIRFLRR